MYPEMPDIPKAISNSQRSKLIATFEARRVTAHHEVKATNGQPAKVPIKGANAPLNQKENGLSKSKDKWPSSAPDEQRAFDLQRKFPNENVPRAVSKSQFKALNNTYENRDAKKPKLGAPTGPNAQLPSRPPPTGPARAMRPGKAQRRAHAPHARERMLPPSNARRAEVARNLMGNSNDEPISLD